MSTNTELELRPLEAHELDLVNGAGVPVQTASNIIGWGYPGGALLVCFEVLRSQPF